jgi:hypothetical protein
MLWATKSDLPAVAPRGQPDHREMFIGLVTHLKLSASFGVVFALLVPFLRSQPRLAAGAVAFGVAIYLVNFQSLGRTAFPWFQEGPDQLFELVAHAGFGLFLGRSSSSGGSGQRSSKRKDLGPARSYGLGRETGSLRRGRSDAPTHWLLRR